MSLPVPVTDQVQTNSENPTASGQCLCGAISFQCDLPFNWVAHCHCSMCQKNHGAAFVTWASAPDESWQMQGEQDLNWYQSSAKARRGFCRHCGTSLYFQSSDYPSETHIPLAIFSTPIKQQPQMHGFYETHVDWFRVEDELPKKYSNSDDTGAGE